MSEILASSKVESSCSATTERSFLIAESELAVWATEGITVATAQIIRSKIVKEPRTQVRWCHYGEKIFFFWFHKKRTMVEIAFCRIHMQNLYRWILFLCLLVFFCFWCCFFCFAFVFLVVVVFFVLKDRFRQGRILHSYQGKRFYKCRPERLCSCYSLLSEQCTVMVYLPVIVARICQKL